MKRILALMLSGALVLSSFSIGFAADENAVAENSKIPTDVVGLECENAVAELIDLKIVNGFPDGSYKPENKVTRAEMTTFIINALELNDKGLAIYGGSFSDAKKHWAKGTIGYAEQLSFISGYSDGSFKPNNVVSADEAVSVLIRALGYEPSALKGNWPLNFRNKAIELKIVDSNFDWNADINRGQLAILLQNTLNLPIGNTDAEGTWTINGKDTMKLRLTGDEEIVAPGTIPYGDRILNEYGLDGAVADSIEDINNSKYYETPDFYNALSNDRLTMLTKFKTTQQMTGWSCGPTSATMVLEWYNMRGDLNEMDLAYLRDRKPGGPTTLKEMLNIFDGLEKKLGQKWDVVSSYDMIEDEDGSPMLEVEKGKKLYLEETIPYYLSQGKPMIVGWEDWAGHYQVIVGYDNMGTEVTQDDVIIFADPYDTTDHKQDGYLVQSYERFVYNWSVGFDPDFDSCVFLVASPEEYKYTPATKGTLITNSNQNLGKFTDVQVLPYSDKMKEQLAELAKNYNSPIEIGENKLSGPADSAYYRKGDYNQSPYYKLIDGYNMKSSGSLSMIENFKTIQQATEYTCGVTSMLMTLEHFEKRGDLSEMDLAAFRDKKDKLPGTTVKEMLNVIGHLDSKWDIKSSADMVERDSDLGAGIMIDGKYMDLGEMIPYYIEKNIPVMIMWHEWGGHWQAIIGYDTMGTEGTQDDVLILADPYDTTDHNQDGYVVESFERFIYDWGNTYDEEYPWGGFVVMSPQK